MLGGYTGKLLKVSFSTGKSEQKLNERIAFNFLGGRGYASKIL